MTDEATEPAGDDEERTPRPPIVIPKSTRLAIGVAVIVVGLLLLVFGAVLVKVIGVVVVLGGLVDVFVGRRQAL